ncbi:Glycerol uptake protein 1 [Vitis vinifera]|uniref:Glycerol uptake protein 1 n=1 Tax=Vitis vinifera TaxID=29760 RepID=A0A438BV38_VITVI|nr:Glycerol uptake protein 1 [Vitis vinifera]
MTTHTTMQLDKVGLDCSVAESKEADIDSGVQCLVDYASNLFEAYILSLESTFNAVIFVKQGKHVTYIYRFFMLPQERSVQNDKFSFSIYLCYLVYAPLYIAGPIVSFNAFASQLDMPQNNYSVRDVSWYGLRWLFSLFLMELMTHLFYYNAFAISGLWKQLSPMDVFIIGYGVLNFMWLKFFLMWRYFRLWSLICGIEAPENMPRCINNCYNLESFWKNWHASFNKWLVRKLLSWAWLTCLFFVPEMILKSLANAFQAESAFGEFIFRELSAVAGAVTITCLMVCPFSYISLKSDEVLNLTWNGLVISHETEHGLGFPGNPSLMFGGKVANLVGYVIGPSGINWFISQFLQKEGLPILGGMFITFYVGTKVNHMTYPSIGSLLSLDFTWRVCGVKDIAKTFVTRLHRVIFPKLWTWEGTKTTSELMGPSSVPDSHFSIMAYFQILYNPMTCSVCSQCRPKSNQCMQVGNNWKFTNLGTYCNPAPPSQCSIHASFISFLIHSMPYKVQFICILEQLSIFMLHQSSMNLILEQLSLILGRRVTHNLLSFPACLSGKIASTKASDEGKMRQWDRRVDPVTSL